MTEELAIYESKSVVEQTSPMALAQQFLTHGGDIANLEKMLALQEKYDALQAKKAYVADMAKFKMNPPTIMKDKKVGFSSKKPGVGSTNYSHATLGNVTRLITKGLGEYGFSSAWPLEQTDKGIKVTCTITHKKGHSESTSLFAASDNTGNKNSIQAVGSTISYLERYTLLALTGLATEDQDDDGKAAVSPIPFITEKQVSEITDMINSTEADEEKFLEWLEVEKIESIPMNLFNKAMAGLKAKVKK